MRISDWSSDVCSSDLLLLLSAALLLLVGLAEALVGLGRGRKGVALLAGRRRRRMDVFVFLVVLRLVRLVGFFRRGSGDFGRLAAAGHLAAIIDDGAAAQHVAGAWQAAADTGGAEITGKELLMI